MLRKGVFFCESFIPRADAFTKTGKASKVLGNGIVESGLKHLDNVADGIKKLVKKADDAIDLEKHLPKKLLKEEAEAFAKKADKVADDVVEDAAKAIKSGRYSLPQGISQEQFSNASKLLRDRVGDISNDIVVQGSRAKGTAKPTSDIDIALRVSGDKFDSLINQYFKTPNPGSAKERTMLHAIETGKIQAGEAKLSGLRKELQEIFGMEVDISIIKQGGAFDNPPFIPFE